MALASGPDGQTPLPQNSNTATFSARLTAAGTYTLSVCLVDALTQRSAELQPSAQLRGITVVPGAVCPHKTTVEAMPERLVAGVTYTCRICPVDAFGNAGASGTADLLLSSSASHAGCLYWGFTTSVLHATSAASAYNTILVLVEPLVYSCLLQCHAPDAQRVPVVSISLAITCT